ncbi:hypothetical protein H7U37_08530 [Pseudoflavonifractor phocaeensis]|uniref:hypothetical protein n=1 Tax=Pseudoflavonifractor phocaeensis TaxID=1870988 RepID=UPI0019580E10|nr:hypothetical protein [Pseudoflavonifractor phocaeensis]MBM6869562.1 hypothetical protein [Pseudoflavonifractor phocaeensis]MBM6938566.1 hypothetical protein [Pseudoflavonifractor phocaeensis]
MPSGEGRGLAAAAAAILAAAVLPHGMIAFGLGAALGYQGCRWLRGWERREGGER